jgi:hypothetical protein
MDVFNKRVSKYTKHILDRLDEGTNTMDFPCYYAGGTLCLDIPFWKKTPSKEQVVDLIFLNLSGASSSTIYGDHILTPENVERVKQIYLKVKGNTEYYKEHDISTVSV